MLCPTRRARARASAILFVAAPLTLSGLVVAQGYREYDAPSYRDFELVRSRPTPWATGLVLRAGLVGNVAIDEDPALGTEDATTFDGSVWFRGDHLGDREAQVDLYAGRDGVFASLRDGRREETGGRLEVSGRFFPFWREGFYRGGDFVPTGQYEGSDFGAFLGFTAPVADAVTAEFGPFWRRYSFARNEQTQPTYEVPDDFDTYGGRVLLQHETLAFDRGTGRPVEGFLLGARIEYERNGSDEPFGTAVWTSSLPTSFWRGSGHLEWYFPTAGGSVWEFQADGSMSDETDRVYNYDQSKPAGHLWIDGSLGYRLEFGRFAVTPSGRVQWTRTVDERGSGSDENFWFGGGLKILFGLGDSLELIADYSFLNNPNRPTVEFDRDVAGEHQFFVGLELRLGMSNR